VSDVEWLGSEHEGKITVVFSEEDVACSRRSRFRYLEDTPFNVRGKPELASGRLLDLVGLEVLEATDSWSTIRIFRGKLIVLEVALSELRGGVFPTRINCPEREILSLELVGAEHRVVVACHWRHAIS
jgi:hypothetical protein